MITVLSELDKFQMAAVRLKAAIFDDPTCSDVVKQYKEMTDAIGAFFEVIAPYESMAKKPNFIADFSLLDVLKSAQAFVKEIKNALVKAWGEAAIDMSKQLAALIPPDWVQWTITKPDPKQVKEKLPAKGFAKKLSNLYEAGTQLKTQIEKCHGIVGHKCKGGFADEIEGLSNTLEEAQRIVNVQYVTKYTYQKIPAEERVAHKKQMVRDVKRKLKGSAIPEDLMAQLSNAASCRRRGCLVHFPAL